VDFNHVLVLLGGRPAEEKADPAIVARGQRAVAEIAEAQGIDVVLDRSGMSQHKVRVILGVPQVGDITDDVIWKLRR
jgi:Skp family chaperone for outer membrane proteins